MGNPGLSTEVKMGIPALIGALLWWYRRAFGKPTWMEAGTPVYFALAWLITQLGNGFFPCGWPAGAVQAVDGHPGDLNAAHGGVFQVALSPGAVDQSRLYQDKRHHYSGLGGYLPDPGGDGPGRTLYPGPVLPVDGGPPPAAHTCGHLHLLVPKVVPRLRRLEKELKAKWGTANNLTKIYVKTNITS